MDMPIYELKINNEIADDSALFGVLEIDGYPRRLCHFDVGN